MSVLLNIKHENFAYNVASGLNYITAYKRVYGSHNYTGASELVNTPEVKARIEEIKNDIYNSQMLGVKEITSYLTGVITTPISEINEDSIYAEEVETLESGEGENSRKKVKVKAFSKKSAIELLGKITGSELFKKEELQVNVTPEAEFLHAIRSGKSDETSD